MENVNKKILIFGQLIYLIESIVYLSIGSLVVLNRIPKFSLYFTFSEGVLFSIFGITLSFILLLLLFKLRVMAVILLSIRIVILIYSLMCFSNSILLSIIEVLIFIYSVIYIYAYLNYKKR